MPCLHNSNVSSLFVWIFNYFVFIVNGSVVVQMVKKKKMPAMGDRDSIPGSGSFPWRREWLLTPVFLPGESHGQRSLEGCNPSGRKELDTTKRLTLFTFTVNNHTEGLHVHRRHAYP